MLRQDRGLTPPPPWNNHLDPMSREDEAKNDRLFDSRTVERNIRKGLITRKDYEKYLKGLNDVTDKIAPPEAPRAIMSAVAEPELDHLDAGLDDEDDDDQVQHAGAPLDGQSTAAADDDLGDGDIDDLDEEDLEDDEDDVDTEPPKN